MQLVLRWIGMSLKTKYILKGITEFFINSLMNYVNLGLLKNLLLQLPDTA
jgi:hypothetical protein